MADTPLDFVAYRELHAAALAAERLILRLRTMAFALLPPNVEQGPVIADIVGELEIAPEIAQLRRALGRHDPLPPALTVVALDAPEEAPPAAPPDKNGPGTCA